MFLLVLNFCGNQFSNPCPHLEGGGGATPLESFLALRYIYYKRCLIFCIAYKPFYTRSASGKFFFYLWLLSYDLVLKMSRPS